MLIHRKVESLIICAVILLAGIFCSFSHAASYRYATTDMTWAEFYAGETGQTSSSLESSGLDAVSTATVRFTTRFNQTVSSVSDSGSMYTGLKDVQVRMTDEVYESLMDRSRYKFVNETFTEYKDVNSDGSFGKMITETKAADANVTLSSGASSSHGDYILNVGIDFDSLGLKLGETASSFDYYIGATVETNDGKVYGLRPLYNMWVRATQLGFSVKDFTERNGTVLSSKYTSDLQGKTITKITYMLKNQPDPFIDNLNIYVKGNTTATAAAVYEEGFKAYEIADGTVNAQLRVSNAPADSSYASISSISYDDPNGHHGWSTLPADSYTVNYANGVILLTLRGDIASATHTYRVYLSDEKYVDIMAEFKTFTTDATSLIISGDNLGGLNFLITPEGAVESVDAELVRGNFVNASDFTSPDLNHSVPLSGMRHQVEGSGFSFDITLNNLPSGKTAVVGFGKIFYLTPENCGEAYPTIYSAIDELETYPSGFKAVNGDMFRTMGLRAMSVRGNESVDLTSYMGAGAMIMTEDSIMIYYGVMVADANTGEINEGGTYAFSPEGETLVSDGIRDGHLIMSMWFEVQEDESDPDTDPDPQPNPTPTLRKSSSGGCDSLNLTCTAALLMFAFMKSSRK